MERHFFIEAKSFCFSAKEGSFVLCLEERRKDFVRYIFAGNQCSSWLVDTVEEASKEKDDIAKSYRAGDKVLMVHGVLIVNICRRGKRDGGCLLFILFKLI